MENSLYIQLFQVDIRRVFCLFTRAPIAIVNIFSWLSSMNIQILEKKCQEEAQVYFIIIQVLNGTIQFFICFLHSFNYLFSYLNCNSIPPTHFFNPICQYHGISAVFPPHFSIPHLHAFSVIFLANVLIQCFRDISVVFSCPYSYAKSPWFFRAFSTRGFSRIFYQGHHQGNYLIEKIFLM